MLLTHLFILFHAFVGAQHMLVALFIFYYLYFASGARKFYSLLKIYNLSQKAFD